MCFDAASRAIRDTIDRDDAAYNARPMRARAFHRLMLHAAFAAVCALVLLPTLGRVSGALSSASIDWVQMCTARGLEWIAVGDSVARADAGMQADATRVPSPKLIDAGTLDDGDAPHHAGFGDCAYCPLLAALATAVLWIVLQLFSAPRTMRAPQARAAWTWPTGHPSGLGSRGPPLPL